MMQPERTGGDLCTKDYQPGDEALVIVKDPTKMEDRMEGPCTVTQVFNNGTVAIQRTPNAHCREDQCEEDQTL